MHNGKLLPEGATPISPANRSFRFGDGLFETIRMSNGSLPLWSFHAHRLWKGMGLMKFELPKLFHPEKLEEDIQKTCHKNGLKNARIRLTVFRGDGGLYDPVNLHPNYIIETWPLTEAIPLLNSNGLQTGFYEEGRKSIDAYSNVKSNNFLPYAMAALYAKEQQWNDAIILNTFGRIADSTMANIFWVKDDEVFTCPLSEAPIAGTMRKRIMEQEKVVEMPCSKEELLQSDEVFFTNAVRGIQWVAGIADRRGLANRVSSRLYQEIIVPLFS